MTTPAASPRLPQADGAVDKSGPSRKAIIGWTIVMLVVVGLAWFIGAVALPMWQVRVTGKSVDRYSQVWLLGRGDRFGQAQKEIKQLGGPEEAAVRISRYLRVGNCPDTHRECIPSMLSYCGTKAVPALLELLSDKKWYARYSAAVALEAIEDQRSVPNLIQALRDEQWDVRYAAANALGTIRSSLAVEELERTTADEDRRVRGAAHTALKKIKAAQEKKK